MKFDLDHAERIIFDNEWSIAIPDGFTYSFNEDQNAINLETGIPYEFILHKESRYTELDDPFYQFKYVFAVIGHVYSDMIVDCASVPISWETRRSQEKKESQFFVKTKNFAIYYATAAAEDSFVCYNAAVVVRNAIYQCAMRFNGEFCESDCFEAFQQLMSTMQLAEEVEDENVNIVLSDEDAEDYEIDSHGVLVNYWDDKEEYILPTGIKKIGDNLFRSNGYIKTVIIPEGVTEIGHNAFQECEALTRISLPSTLKKIGECAFMDCNALKEITIPASVHQMGLWTFSIEGGEDRIFYVKPGSYAEVYCSDCNYNYRYINCRYMEDEEPENDESDDDITLKIVPGLQSTDYIINSDNVLESYNGEEINIVIPAGVKKIGKEAFYFKKVLFVSIPEGVEEIEEDAFAFCTELEKICLPSTLKRIKRNAFDNCESLTEVVIPDGVLEIEGWAFGSCSNLKDVYIPASVIEIETCAFYLGCDEMSFHVVKGSYAEIYCVENELKFCYQDEIPKSVMDENIISATKKTPKQISTEKCSIEGKVLTDYFGLARNIILPSGIEKIGEYAFPYDIETVVIPEGVTEIESGAFLMCKKLKHVTLPSTLKQIGEEAFLGCDNLILIVIKGSYAEQYCKENNLSYSYV